MTTLKLEKVSMKDGFSGLSATVDPKELFSKRKEFWKMSDGIILPIIEKETGKDQSDKKEARESK
jgi:hypothetical protein